MPSPERLYEVRAPTGLSTRWSAFLVGGLWVCGIESFNFWDSFKGFLTLHSVRRSPALDYAERSACTSSNMR